jgi:hypothetical protein
VKTPEYLSVTLQSHLSSKLGCEVSKDAAIMMRDMFADAQREARAAALEEAAAKAEEYATTGSSHKATVIAKAIRALAKDRP